MKKIALNLSLAASIVGLASLIFTSTGCTGNGNGQNGNADSTSVTSCEIAYIDMDRILKEYDFANDRMSVVQTKAASVEQEINRRNSRGESLTAASLNELYHELKCRYFGDGIVIDPEIDVEWARIPHFYYDYYVYQYATGYSAAIALSRRILKEGEPAVKDYINFLSGGCSADPITLLRGAGVDMATAQPINEALQLFDELIDEMEQLMQD